MRWKVFLSFIFTLFAVSLLVIYWFVPINTTEFGVKTGSSNFSLSDYGRKNMQFYNNMRYSDSRISYRIQNCPLQKKDDMERAFGIVDNLTVLDFYPVEVNEEIFVTCDSRNRIEGDLFIAGEGGPANITKAGEFNVILNGKVLLIKQSSCPDPNIGLHELFHALGFDHSLNPNNIMYNISKCGQTTGQDILDLINELYAIPSYPDLVFEDVSAIMRGKYLDANISIRNNGLKDSPKSSLEIYIDGKLLKEFELDEMKIGAGRAVTLGNVWVSKINIEGIEFVINSDFNELETKNNRVVLEIKK